MLLGRSHATAACEKCPQTNEVTSADRLGKCCRNHLWRYVTGHNRIDKRQETRLLVSTAMSRFPSKSRVRCLHPTAFRRDIDSFYAFNMLYKLPCPALVIKWNTDAALPYNVKVTSRLRQNWAKPQRPFAEPFGHT